MHNMYVSQNQDLAFRVIDGEAVILTVWDGMLHNLNPVATRVFELSDGKTMIQDIVSKVCSEFEVSQDSAKKDILDFIEDMVHKKMLKLDVSPISK